MAGYWANGFSSFGRVEGYFFGKYFRQKAVAPISNLLPSLAANRSNPREAFLKKSALICCLNGEVHFSPRRTGGHSGRLWAGAIIKRWTDCKSIPPACGVADVTPHCILHSPQKYSVFCNEFQKLGIYVLLEQVKLNSCRRNTYIRFISKIVFPSKNDCIILTMQFMKAAQRMLH